ncbi:GTP cyclohydrolase I [Bradyrhizobium sp. LM3.2]
MKTQTRRLERVAVAQAPSERPERAEVEQAIRTMIRWAGDDPARDGLRDTPDRVTRAFEEYFSGYAQDPTEILPKDVRGDRRL